jgi:hypothetical protein
MPFRLLLQLFAILRNLTTKTTTTTPATQTESTHYCQPSLQPGYVLDRDVLTIELRDPVFRQFYMEHLENCLAMPSFQKQ